MGLYIRQIAMELCLESLLQLLGNILETVRC